MLLRRPVNGAGGVVVFSHRELPILAALDRIGNQDWDSLVKESLIAVHFGFRHVWASLPRSVDVVLGGEGTLPRWITGARGRTNYCSRDFVGSHFGSQAQARPWDYISVSRVAKNKRNDREIKVLAELVVSHPNRSFCVILPAPPLGHPARNEYDEVVEEYRKLGFIFNDTESRLTVLKGDESSYPRNLSRLEVATLMRSARIYAHWADREGQSRTISEALRSGCFVLADRGLVGGGLDYLEPKNSELFRNWRDARARLSRLLETDLRPEHNLPSHAENVEKFMMVMENFSRAAPSKAGQGAWLMDELDFRLPSHGCPAELGREFETPELGSDDGWQWLIDVGLLRLEPSQFAELKPYTSPIQRLWRWLRQ